MTVVTVPPISIRDQARLRFMARSALALRRVRAANRTRLAHFRLQNYLASEDDKAAFDEPIEVTERSYTTIIGLLSNLAQDVYPMLVSWRKSDEARYLGDDLVYLLVGLTWHPHFKSGSVTEPRSRKQYRAFCGVGEPKLRYFTGMTQEDTFKLGLRREVRPLLHIMVTQVMKQSRNRPPLYERYVREKESYLDREDMPNWRKDMAARRNVAQYIVDRIYTFTAEA